MKYITSLLLSLSAMASTSYICEIDELDASFTDESYLIVDLTKSNEIKSIMTMPLRTSDFDEMTRLDNCFKSEFKNISLCVDSNKFNKTDPSYVSFNKRDKSISWYGKVFNENYSIIYNCTPL